MKRQLNQFGGELLASHMEDSAAHRVKRGCAAAVWSLECASKSLPANPFQPQHDVCMESGDAVVDSEHYGEHYRAQQAWWQAHGAMVASVACEGCTQCTSCMLSSA